MAQLSACVHFFEVGKILKLFLSFRGTVLYMIIQNPMNLSNRKHAEGAVCGVAVNSHEDRNDIPGMRMCTT